MHSFIITFASQLRNINDLSGKLYAARVRESSENNVYMMVQEPPSLQECVMIFLFT